MPSSQKKIFHAGRSSFVQTHPIYAPHHGSPALDTYWPDRNTHPMVRLLNWTDVRDLPQVIDLLNRVLVEYEEAAS